MKFPLFSQGYSSCAVQKLYNHIQHSKRLHKMQQPCFCPFIRVKKDFFKCSRVSENSIWHYSGYVREHQTRHVTDLVLQDHPLLQRLTANPACYLCFWLSSYKLDVLRPPSNQDDNPKSRLLPLLLTNCL